MLFRSWRTSISLNCLHYQNLKWNLTISLGLNAHFRPSSSSSPNPSSRPTERSVRFRSSMVCSLSARYGLYVQTQGTEGRGNQCFRVQGTLPIDQNLHYCWIYALKIDKLKIYSHLKIIYHTTYRRLNVNFCIYIAKPISSPARNWHECGSKKYNLRQRCPTELRCSENTRKV